MKIAKETWIILAIGMADLATTIVFIQNHGAQEANPLFQRYWEMGLAAFVSAKIALLVGPLYVVEWARKRNPRFVSWALRGGIVAYIAMYAVGYVRLNQDPMLDRDLAVIPAPPIQVTGAFLAPARTLPVMRLPHMAAKPVTASDAVTAY
jgi:hypothetical protein